MKREIFQQPEDNPPTTILRELIEMVSEQIPDITSPDTVIMPGKPVNIHPLKKLFQRITSHRKLSA